MRICHILLFQSKNYGLDSGFGPKMRFFQGIITRMRHSSSSAQSVPRPAVKKSYLAASIRAVFDSPIDALRHLHVPAPDAYDIVSASWHSGPRRCLVCAIGGGRGVAAVRTPENRWAACMVFWEGPCATRDEAKRLLEKRIKRGEQGLVFRGW
jgi:hypothetical protein